VSTTVLSWPAPGRAAQSRPPAAAGFQGPTGRAPRWRPARSRRRQAATSRPGNHRTIIGAELQSRVEHLGAGRARRRRKSLAQAAIGAHAAGDHQPRDAGLLDRAQALADQRVNDGFLELQRHVRPRLFVQFEVADSGDHRGLQAAEAEIQPRPVEHRPRQAQAAGSAALGEARELRPARVAEAQHLGGLVEGLAGGVVERLAQHPVAAQPGDLHQHAVAARDQQRDEREVRRRVFQHRRQQVALHVVHADRRHAPGPRQAAAHAGPHQQRPDQPGPGRVGHPVECLGRRAGLFKHLFYQRKQLADVVAGGELRHHAAELGMQLHLAVQGVRQQAALGVEHGHPGLVTGGLDAEHSHCLVPRGCLPCAYWLSPRGAARMVGLYPVGPVAGPSQKPSGW
jgi:hypothetical protein